MKMERKNINDYLSKSNLELLTDFKWGIQGQNDFGQFMNLVRKQAEKVEVQQKEIYVDEDMQ
jgi:hypothetical protein